MRTALFLRTVRFVTTRLVCVLINMVNNQTAIFIEFYRMLGSLF